VTIKIDKTIIFRDVTPCNLVEIYRLLIGCDAMYVKITILLRDVIPCSLA